MPTKPKAKPKPCMVVSEKALYSFIRRYDGVVQPPLTDDEVEILLFALYLESKKRGGIVATAYRRNPV